MDIHDMGARSDAGNRYFLVIVDRASKFLFAYPLPNKSAEGLAKKLLELLLTFGIPLSLRSDTGHGVHRGGCPTPLQMAQRGDSLWPY